MFSRPTLGVNTAVYANMSLNKAISNIAQLDVDGIVVKLPNPVLDLAKVDLHGLKLFGIELIDYGFGQLPKTIDQIFAFCQAQQGKHLIIPNPIQLEPTTPAQAKQFVMDVRQLADTAVSRDINLVVKVAHRFETSLLNNLDQVENFLAEVERPNVKVELGTFDLQMEEQDGAGQMGRLGERLAFLRMSDSNQGAIGEGNMKLGAYLWAIQELAHNPPILLDVKRPFLAPFSDVAPVKSIQESLLQSRSWF